MTPLRSLTVAHMRDLSTVRNSRGGLGASIQRLDSTAFRPADETNAAYAAEQGERAIDRTSELHPHDVLRAVRIGLTVLRSPPKAAGTGSRLAS